MSREKTRKKRMERPPGGVSPAVEATSSVPAGDVAMVGGLLLLTIAVYMQVFGFDFLNYDDPVYVFDNEVVSRGLSWYGVKWAFATTVQAHWHPFTVLSHMLDSQLFGLKPAGHHAVSLLLHLANTGLLYALSRRLFGGGRFAAFLVAAFFAVHPLHVESVAWVSSRKDLLSGIFFLLTLLAYERFANDERRRWQWYGAALAAAVAGLLSKAMLVTIPGVLLLLDIWPLGRVAAAGGMSSDQVWRTFTSPRLWIEKLPFVGAGLAVSALAIIMRGERLVGSGRDLLSVGERLLRAADGAGMYLAKALWPYDLTVGYKYVPTVPVSRAAAFAALLTAITVAAVVYRKRSPALFVGWFWYLGMLLPVAGLIQTGPQELAYRYTYLPLIGISLMVVWGVPNLFKRFRDLPAVSRHPGLPSVAAALLVIWWASTCLSYVRVWRDDVTLFTHSLKVNPSNWPALNSLGWDMLRQGQTKTALGYLTQAYALHPNNIEIKSNLAEALSREAPDAATMERAIALFREVLATNPDSEQARVNLGIALAKAGKNRESLSVFAEVVRKSPDRPKGHYNFANVLASEGRVDEAIRELETALRLDPDYMLAQKLLDKLKNGKKP